jgi:multimeric flavodoxin WrbA
MKVLGLVASPRKLGNSEIITKEILAALPATAEKELVRLPDLDIQPCKACYACLASDQACTIKDDLGSLLDKIRAADAVVIASACYFLGPHTSVKIVNDRLISVLANTDFAGKRCITAVVYGIPGWEGYAREAVLNFARFLHLDVVGDMLVQAASPGEAVTPEVLAEARQMAARLLEGDGEPSRPGVLTCPRCGSSLLQVAPTGEVRCVMCDARGRIKSKDGQVSVEFDRREHYRFSSAGRDEHVQLLAEIRQRYLANRSEYYNSRKPYEKFDYWWAE